MPMRRASGMSRLRLWPGEAFQRDMAWSTVREPATRFSADTPLMPKEAMRLANSPCESDPACATARACTSAARFSVGSTTTSDSPLAVRYWLTIAAADRASPVLVETRSAGAPPLPPPPPKRLPRLLKLLRLGPAPVHCARNGATRQRIATRIRIIEGPFTGAGLFREAPLTASAAPVKALLFRQNSGERSASA